MKFRRRAATVDTSRADVFLGKVHARLHAIVDEPLTDPAVISNIDQLTGSMRGRFVECGVDLADDQVRDALLVLTDIIAASLYRYAHTCATSAQMWTIAAKVAATLLAIDAHERGARP